MHFIRVIQADLQSKKPFILAHKKDIKETDNNGKEFNPSAKSLLEIYPLIKKHNLIKINSNLSEDNILIEAIIQGDIDRIRLLLNNGADVNAKYEHGQTPLMWASKEGRADIVKLLLEKGADVNAKDRFNQTSLMYASKYAFTDIVKLLLEKGANVDIKNIFGNTALDETTNHEIKQLLKQYSKK